MGILSRLTGGPSDALARSRAFRAAGPESARTLAQNLGNTQLHVRSEGTPSTPVRVSTPEGYDVICAFTSPELTTDPVVAAEASWVLAKLPVGCGIVIDAGTDGCRFLEPESVGWLREELRLVA